MRRMSRYKLKNVGNWDLQELFTIAFAFMAFTVGAVFTYGIVRFVLAAVDGKISLGL
jgi:hypothetical protein